MFRSTIAVSIFAALGAVVSFLNQVVLAKYFGAGAEMDAYLIASGVPTTISGLLVGVLNYQLVPALQHAESDAGRSSALLRSLLLGIGLPAIMVSGLAIVSAPGTIDQLYPGLKAEHRELVIEITRISWVSLPLSLVNAVYTAGLHIRQRFLIVAGVASAPMLGSMIVSAGAHRVIGTAAVAWGQLFGYVAMLGCLRLAYGDSGRGYEWRRFRRLMSEFPASVLAVMIFVLYPFVDAFWGAKVGASTVSYLGYSQRLIVGFSGLAVVGLTTVLFPKLARHAAEGQAAKLLQELEMSMKLMLTYIVPGAVGFAMLSTPLIQVLFQRGSFGMGDAETLGKFLPIMLAGMIPMSCCSLIFKALFACRKSGVAAAFSLGASIVYSVCSGIFSETWGIFGIGVAYAVSWWALFIAGLCYLWREYAKKPLVAGNLRYFLKLAVLVLVVVGLCAGVRAFLPPLEMPGHRGRILVLVAAGLLLVPVHIVYVVAADLVPGLRDLLSRTGLDKAAVRR